jgi:hypothetical protein
MESRETDAHRVRIMLLAGNAGEVKQLSHGEEQG